MKLKPSLASRYVGRLALLTSTVPLAPTDFQDAQSIQTVKWHLEEELALEAKKYLRRDELAARGGKVDLTVHEKT